jgi:hypothetical protein
MNISKKYLSLGIVGLLLLVGSAYLYLSGDYVGLFKSFAQIPFTLDVDSDSTSPFEGEIFLEIGDSTFPLLSHFSYPSSPKGFYSLPDIDATSGLNISVTTITSGLDYVIDAQSNYYTIKRSVVKKENRVDVTDVIKNTTTSALSVDLKNYAVLPDVVFDPAAVYLGGKRLSENNLKNSFGNYVNPNSNDLHPTFFYHDGENGIGIAVTDSSYKTLATENLDVYQDQIEGGVVGYSLNIAPGQSETRTWSIYPVPGTNYNTFISQASADFPALVGASIQPSPTFCSPAILCLAPPEDCYYQGGGACTCGTLICPEVTPPTPLTGEQLISLKSGWNQVGSPAGDLNIGNIPRCKIDKLVSYNETSKAYQDTQVMTPMRGYWAHSSETCTFSVVGADTHTKTLALKSGWNLISSEKSWSDIKGSCSLASVIWHWDTTTGQYTEVSATTPLNDSLSYWVNVGQDCLISEN